MSFDIPAEAEDFLGGSPENMTLDEGIGALAEGIASHSGGILRAAALPAVTVLTAALFCGAAETAFAGRDRTVKVIPLAGALAIVAAAGSDLASLMDMGRSAVETLNSFSKGLLASLAAAGGVLGSPGGAAARYTAAMIFSDALATVIERAAVPALYVYVAVATADAAVGGDSLAGLAKLIKSAVTAALGTLLAAFTLYLALSGIAAGGADALAIKAAKAVISNAVPVVGGVLSDASETVIVSTRAVRSAAGITGLIAFAALVLPPFLHIGLRYLFLKLAAAVSPLVCEGRLSKLIENLTGAFGMLLGMLGACSLITLVSALSMISLSSG